MPPDDIRLVIAHGLAGEPVSSPQLRITTAQVYQPGDEIDQLGIRITPVKPGQRIVLAIGVVVATLRAPEFVAPLQHRHTLGDQQRRQ